jgi:hypothetical protein
MIVPKICGNRGTEDTRGVHGRAGKRSSEQDVESNCRSYNESSDTSRPSFIDSGAMNHKHQKESQDPFDQDPLSRREINRKLWRAGYDDVASEQAEAN